jgi:hypothetical protein
MASHTSVRIVALGLIVIAAGAGGYWLSRPETTLPIVGVVRTTEVRIAPEVDGQLTAIKGRKGDRVRAGDVVAELSAPCSVSSRALNDIHCLSVAARVVRDLAGGAGDRRSRPQHAAPAPRPAGRSGRARALHDGLAQSLSGGGSGRDGRHAAD